MLTPRSYDFYGTTIIETGNYYGNMNTNKNFYPEHYTEEQRNKAFMNARMALARNLGFDANKFFMALQKDKTGTWFEITPDYVKANPNGWSDIKEDILIVTDKTPGVVIGHPVADCPVVMAYDEKQKIAAIAHCSADLVDKKMPMSVIDSLSNAFNSKDDDIYVYVSACAGKNWTYDKYPDWAKDSKIWKNVIKEDKNGIYHINLKKAVENQLLERNISEFNINISHIDTISDNRFYSNSAAYKGVEGKKGRNFAGIFINDKNVPKREILNNILAFGSICESIKIDSLESKEKCLEVLKFLKSRLEIIDSSIRNSYDDKEYKSILCADYNECERAIELLDGLVNEKMEYMGKDYDGHYLVKK